MPFLLPGEKTPKDITNRQYISTSFKQQKEDLVPFFAGVPQISKKNVLYLSKFNIQYFP